MPHNARHARSYLREKARTTRGRALDLPGLYKTVSQFFPDYWLGTLASAAFGAFAGAWINNRIQTKRAIIEQLNAVRAALVLCFSISNRFMLLKRQNIRPLRNRYVKARPE